MRVAIAIALTLLASSAPAFAQAPPPPAPIDPPDPSPAIRLPVREVDRPLTLPRHVLSIDVTPYGGHGSYDGYGGLSLGATFGITDDVEVWASFVDLELAPSPFPYYSAAGVTARLVRGTFELGLTGSAAFEMQAVYGAGLTFEVPMAVHLGSRAKLLVTPDVFVNIPFTSRESMSPGALLMVKTTGGAALGLGLVGQVVDRLSLGANTGITVSDFSDLTRGVAVPLGFSVHGTLAGEKGPSADLGPYFSWPALLQLGSSDRPSNPGVYQVGVALRGFVYL